MVCFFVETKRPWKCQAIGDEEKEGALQATCQTLFKAF
jgi:hypothetical protein